MDFDTIFSLYSSRFKNTRTVQNYISVIEKLRTVTGKDFLDCTADDAAFFCKELERQQLEGRISYNTCYARISMLSSIGEYIEKEQLIAGYTNVFSSSRIAWIDNDIKHVDLPLLADLEIIMEAARLNCRDFTILSLVIKCGLSLSELHNLNTDCLLYDHDSVIAGLRISSGKSCVDIVLPDDVAHILSLYMASMAFPAGSSLFRNTRGNALSIRSFQRMLAKYVDDCSSQLIRKDINFRQLRHLAIYYMKQGGASQSDIAAYTGLTEKTITRYNKLSSDCAADAASYSVLSVNP